LNDNSDSFILLPSRDSAINFVKIVKGCMYSTRAPLLG
jgi:hypothetical protein